LKSAIYHGDKKIDNIRDLESKDLGVIFELLFTDAEFVKTSRAKVNEKSWQFTKKEIIATLQSIAEDTVWNSLLGKESVIDLSNNFLTVKNYRNDVMHAHNIDAKTFRDAKKLFVDINKQLDEEIGLIIQKVEEKPEELTSSNFNAVLNTALQMQNMSSTLQEIRESITKITGAQNITMQDALRQFYDSYDYARVKEELASITSTRLAFDISELKQQLRETTSYSSELKKILDEVQKSNKRLYLDGLGKNSQTSDAVERNFGKEEDA
jgi:hypothetical protein